jgi:O-antigen ligase/tetratricopeptide (TPR) repeat protein
MYKMLEKILIFGLPVALIVPLLMEKHFLFPFITVKTYFFYILVDILFCCYLLLLTRKKLYPPKSKLCYFLFGLIAVRFILDIFGINFVRSFWGNYERMMGLYTWLHILLYLWMILSIYNTRQRYIKLFDVSIFVSLLVSVYGICQKFGLYFWIILDTGDERVYSTLGNAAFLAGYLLINIFFALYLFCKKENLSWRIFYSSAIVVNLFVLFSTATRGALVGLFAAMMVMLLFVLLFYKNKKVKLISGLILLLIILSGLSVFALKDTWLVKNNLALRRLSQISFQEGTTKSRLLLWKMSCRASQDRFLFGYGDNNLFIPLDRYHDFELTEDWFDSSHNQFFDELLAHGIIGLIIYILFLFFVLKQIIKQRFSDFWLSVVFLGLLTAYLVQGLFIFDTLTIILSFILFFGFLCLATDGKKESIINRTLPERLIKFFIVIILILISFIYLHTIPPLVKVVVGQRYIKVNIDKTIKMFEEAEKQAWFGYDNLAPLMAENTLMVFKHPEKYDPGQLERYISVVSGTYRKAIATSNNYSRFYINLAKLYQSARIINPNFIDESIDLLNEAQKYSPNRIDIYYALAQAYFYKNDLALAESTLNEALKLNIFQGDIYFRLAEIQLRKGKPEDAFRNLEMAEQFDKEITFEQWEKFAKVLVAREKWEDVLKVFFKMDKLRPNDVNIYSNIALTYKKMGNKEKAREFALKILEIDAGAEKTVEVFLKSL